MTCAGKMTIRGLSRVEMVRTRNIDKAEIRNSIL